MSTGKGIAIAGYWLAVAATAYADGVLAFLGAWLGVYITAIIIGHRGE